MSPARFLRPLIVADHRTNPGAVRAEVDRVIHPRAAFVLLHACPPDRGVATCALYGWVPVFEPGEVERAGTTLLANIANVLPERSGVRSILLPAGCDLRRCIEQQIAARGHDVILAPGLARPRWPLVRAGIGGWLARQTLAPVIWREPRRAASSVHAQRPARVARQELLDER
jgi:hypothetical protein